MRIFPVQFTSLLKTCFNVKKWAMENLSIFNKYSLNIPLKYPIGKSLTHCMQAFGSSPSLPLPPLLFFVFTVMIYKFKKICNNNVNIWQIKAHHFILYTSESFALIIMLMNCYAKTCKVSTFFTERIRSLSTFNFSSISDLQIHVFPTLLLVPLSYFLIFIS